MRITYDELLTKISNNGLVKDIEYTFTYTYVPANSTYSYGNHPFDLTVKATSTNTLSSTAKASKISGNQYYANSDLDSWIIYFTTEKYSWVGEGSTGTIYYLKDEWDNVANFDFKNILVNSEYLLHDINGDDMSVSQLSLCRDNRVITSGQVSTLNKIHLKQLTEGNEVKYNNIDSSNTNIIVSGEFNTIYSECSNITLIGDHNTVKNINNQIDINGNGNTINENNDTISIVGDNNDIKDSNNVDIIGSGNSTNNSTDTVINGDNNIVEGGTTTNITGNDNYVNDSTNTVINGNNNNVDSSTGTNLGGNDNIVGDSNNTTITNGDNNVVNGSTNTDISNSNDTTIKDSDDVNGTIPDGGTVDDNILDENGNKTDLDDPDTPVVSDTPITEAPNDDIIYGRQNEEWVPVPIQEDAPADGNAYVRENNGWSKANLGATKWGEIEGNIANQTDLQAALDAKQSNLTAGANISIVDNTVNALGYTLNQSSRGVSVGSSNSTSGTDSFAYGTNCSASGNHSIAGGDNSHAQANDSVALGRGCVAKNVGQAVFGRYNADAANSLLVVGRGTSDSVRRNALEVYEYLLKTSGRIDTYGLNVSPYGPVEYPTTGWKRIFTINNIQRPGMFCIMRSYRFYRPELYLFTYTVGYPNDIKTFKIQQISGGWEDDSAQFIDKVRIGRVGTTTTSCIDIHIAKEPKDGLASNAESFYIFTPITLGSIVLSDSEPEVPTIYNTIETRNMLCDYIATASTSGSTAPYNLKTITNSNFTSLSTKDNNTLYFIV